MGRPPTRPTRLKDGFYIEVRSKGASSGVKIWNPDKETMLSVAADYKKSKEVLILGEHRKDKWIDEQPSNKKKKILLKHFRF